MTFKITCRSAIHKYQAVVNDLQFYGLSEQSRFQLYLQKDQKRATHPESSKPFENFKDVIRGLVPFHVFQTREPPAKDVAAGEFRL